LILIEFLMCQCYLS